MGKIIYRFETPKYPGNIVYINLISKFDCVNNCKFCSKDENNIYERKAGCSLYLSESPSIEEIMEKLSFEKDFDEVAIIGLGEPLIYIDKVSSLVKKIKEKYDVVVRVDTNGVLGDVNKLKELDKIYISLNAVNKEEYNELCNPTIEDSFNKVVAFVKECVKSPIDTYVSFVIFDDSRNKEYISFAKSLGIDEGNVILRDFVW